MVVTPYLSGLNTTIEWQQYHIKMVSVLKEWSWYHIGGVILEWFSTVQ